MKLFVEILPTSHRRDWAYYRPYGGRIGRVLKTAPRSWATEGYWQVLNIGVDLDRFSGYTGIPA